MIEYVSNKGGHHQVDFETAVLIGCPPDGGLYVLTVLPQISTAQRPMIPSVSATQRAIMLWSSIVVLCYFSKLQFHLL